MEPHWACAQLHAQREQLALHCLQIAGFATYLPRIIERRVIRGRMTDAVRPLFPAYTFIWIVDHWWSAMRTPGVIRLIMNGSTSPARVPDGIIDELRRREQADGLIRLPEPRGLQRGDKVLIRDGPFTNLVAVYAGMSGHQRVAVLLALFGGEKRVTLPKDDIIAL